MKLNLLIKKRALNRYILLIQTIVCIFFITILFALRSINKNYSNNIEQWLKYQLNDSLFIGENKHNIYSMENILPVKLSVNIITPVNFSYVSSTFGERNDPICKFVLNKHKGIDLATNFGETIFSVIPGNVEKSGNMGSYGKCIIVNHGNNIKTLYAHCNTLFVNTGNFIQKGQKIATVGTTGKTTGPHLHFEIIINENNYDPESFLNNIHIKSNENKNF